MSVTDEEDVCAKCSYPPVGFGEWQIDVLQTQYIIIYRIEQCEDGKVFKFPKLRIIAKIR